MKLLKTTMFLIVLVNDNYPGHIKSELQVTIMRKTKSKLKLIFLRLKQASRIK